jgi:hypothetical protein
VIGDDQAAPVERVGAAAVGHEGEEIARGIPGDLDDGVRAATRQSPTQ